MKTFGEKMKEARKERGMLQTAFGEMLGVTSRMIIEYEKGARRPHRKKMQEFADILEVPVEYLIEDKYDDVLSVFNQPEPELNEQSVQEETVQQKKVPSDEEISAQAMREMEFLKERSVALFAGGELPQESKDAFFQSLYNAYLKCREQATEKGVDTDKFGY